MSEPGEMPCEELVEVVTDYIEGTLPEEDRIRFEAHLQDCEYCVNYVDQMRAAISTLGRLRADSLSPDTRGELLEAFRGWREG